MDVGAIHELVRDLNFDTFEVPVTLTPVGGPDVETFGIWCTPITEGQPVSGFRQGIRRMEAMKVIALKSTYAGLVTKGLKFDAPDGPGGAIRTFRFDGPTEVFSDHTRFNVVLDTTGDT